MMNLARVGNKFLADTEPWKLAKEDMEAVGCILNYALTLVGNIGIACDPFLPDASKSIRKQLNGDAYEDGMEGILEEGRTGSYRSTTTPTRATRIVVQERRRRRHSETSR